MIEPDFILYRKAMDIDQTTAILNESFQYEHGEEMHQSWNGVFIAFAYMLACASSYSAVHLLDHGLWRADELKKTAIIKHPDIWAAVMLGFGGVWCMHFVGMAAVTLDGAPICYNWLITLGSLAAVVSMMVIAMKVAGNDVFATPDRDKILEEVVGNNYVSDKEFMWAVSKVTYFYKLHFLAIGSFLAASGAVVMHYTGMMAQMGPFRTEWNTGLIATSVIIAIAICFAGFWIIFRLRWKIRQVWLRCVSAAIIALAVCGLHFFGMLSVTYYANQDARDTCQNTWNKNNASPSAWTTHQMVVVAVCIAVPCMCMYISNVINQELILAYEVTSRSNAIVSSLFPAQIRDRMFADDKSRLRSFLNGASDDEVVDTLGGDSVWMPKAKPIADLFTDTTIMFADISGFTAWSSEREPAQVFTLLETIYHCYDEIVRHHGAFKVETIGDCYVAVCGLPDPRPDHAVRMALVAAECVYKMSILTKRLEVTLGPDTGDLQIRIGLNSGSVTAGVLRGERARFQLFGDTMNLASRMESTGLPGRIQISYETAEQLKASGKNDWVAARCSEVFVKGKGELQTFWLNGICTTAGSQASKDDYCTHTKAAGDEFYRLASDKTSRLVEWNVDILAGTLRQIVASRGSRVGKERTVIPTRQSFIKENGSVIDEVCEIIELPEFDDAKARKQEGSESIVLPDKVMEQLQDYVNSIAVLYESNPFHNFEHASHVTMSVSKLLSRIVAHSSDRTVAGKSLASSLHDHTYGITSDPLTRFACILSALIHDVGHEGVPNTQLIKEGSPLAKLYKQQSVAEQNSVDVAWRLFMDDKYKELRSTICGSDAEMQRLRKLIVNSVMATDIMDKNLKNLRNARWDKSFSEKAIDENPFLTRNRKATVVIEHIIQASDVAHTMQHWYVYRKWNECLFEEMYKAYKEGRSEKNPAEFWYQGELGFFDCYIIPLAKKLKDCGVFGVASDEYLNYAIQNRREWEVRGKEVVDEMVDKVNGVWAGIPDISKVSDEVASGVDQL